MALIKPMPVTINGNETALMANYHNVTRVQLDRKTGWNWMEIHSYIDQDAYKAGKGSVQMRQLSLANIDPAKVLEGNAFAVAYEALKRPDNLLEGATDA